MIVGTSIVLTISAWMIWGDISTKNILQSAINFDNNPIIVTNEPTFNPTVRELPNGLILDNNDNVDPSNATRPICNNIDPNKY